VHRTSSYPMVERIDPVDELCSVVFISNKSNVLYAIGGRVVFRLIIAAPFYLDSFRRFLRCLDASDSFRRSLGVRFRLAFPYLVKLHHAKMLEMIEHRNGFSGPTCCCLARRSTSCELFEGTFRFAASMPIYQTGEQ